MPHSEQKESLREQMIAIQSHAKSYEVLLYDDLEGIAGALPRNDCFVVADRKVWELYGHILFADLSEKDVFLLNAVEENKTMESALAVCERMTTMPARRNATLISLGGGITQDVTGFAANILYRGVHWEFIPTTLLAACDSCIGGKTSLNYKNYKNLLGTFFAPDHIHICPRFFQTLSEGDYLSGLGEVFKFNFLTGRGGVERIEENLSPLLERKETIVGEFLLSSLLFKKRFIEEDEFDQGVRVHLNFAHTFGHALETVSEYKIPHGTAVAMGTIAANHVSLSRGWISANSAQRMEGLLLQIIPKEISAVRMRRERLLEAMRKDKKQRGEGLTTVLLKEHENGEMELCVVSDTMQSEVTEAIGYLFSALTRRVEDAL